MTNKNYSLDTGVSIEPLTQTSLFADSDHIDIDKLLEDIKSYDLNQNSVGNQTSIGQINTLTTDMLTSINTLSLGPYTTGVQNSYIGNSTSNGAVGTINIGTNTGSTWQQSFNFENENEKQITKIVRKELKPIIERLAILEQPSTEVLETFESLKMAYDHYKMLEALMSSEIEKIKNKA